MKEKIVLDFDAELKNICNGCAEGVKVKCKQTQKDYLRCVILTSELKEFKVEQVPTTFDELKEMCEDLESKSITIYDDTITIDFPSINGGFNFYIHITEKEIDINTSIFAQNRTIPQLWAFIKSLIGEE